MIFDIAVLIILIVLVDKVLRVGYPTTRTVMVDNIEMQVQAVALGWFVPVTPGTRASASL